MIIALIEEFDIIIQTFAKIVSEHFPYADNCVDHLLVIRIDETVETKTHDIDKQTCLLENTRRFCLA